MRPRRKTLARKRARPDSDVRSDRHLREIAFGDVDKHPDELMIGDAEQYVAGSGPHAVHGVALEDFAILRGEPGNGE